MALKLRVKLGKVTNLSDARYAAGMGVEALGFNLGEDNSTRLSPDDVDEISNWVSGVDIVGELGYSSIDQAAGYNLDYMEFAEAALLPANEQNVLRITVNGQNILEVEDELKLHKDKVKYFILNVNKSELADLGQVLKVIAAQFPLFISTHFTPYNLHYLLEIVQPEGIEIEGGTEEKPGFKDYDEIADVLELLEED